MRSPCCVCGDEFYHIWISQGFQFYISVDNLVARVTEDTPPVETEVTTKVISDGGPSDYYDWPSYWNTLNDFIEYKSEHQWGKFSFHWGNVIKALTRWGDKEGTTEVYDAKKIIYSGVRVLKMLVGVEKTREYLQSLLDDAQFK